MGWLLLARSPPSHDPQTERHVLPPGIYIIHPLLQQDYLVKILTPVKRSLNSDFEPLPFLEDCIGWK